MTKTCSFLGWCGLKSTGDGLTPASGTFDGAFGDGSTIEVGEL